MPEQPLLREEIAPLPFIWQENQEKTPASITWPKTFLSNRSRFQNLMTPMVSKNQCHCNQFGVFFYKKRYFYQ